MPRRTLAELLESRRFKPLERKGLNKMRNDTVFRRKVLLELANRLEDRGRKGDAEAAAGIRELIDSIDWQNVLELVIRYLPIILQILMMLI